jgi:hypothetical protein
MNASNKCLYYKKDNINDIFVSFLHKDDKFSSLFCVYEENEKIHFQLLRDNDWSGFCHKNEIITFDLIISKKNDHVKNMYDAIADFKNDNTRYVKIPLSYHISNSDKFEKNDDFNVLFSTHHYQDQIMFFCPILSIDKSKLIEILYKD